MWPHPWEVHGSVNTCQMSFAGISDNLTVEKPYSQLTVLLSLGHCMISHSQLAAESGCTQNIQLDIDVP